MSKEFTKSYAINRIAELNEQIAEMTDNQNQTMRYLNRIRDENKQLKQQRKEKDNQIEKLKYIIDNYKIKTKQLCKDKFTAIKNMDNAIRNRDKIAKEFAIEKLEKIKDYFVEEDEDGDIDVTKNIFEVVEYINTLITKLKGEI